MFISKTKIINILQWLLTVFLMASFIIFGTLSWGKYLILFFAVLVFLLTVIKNGGKIRIRFELFILLFLAFTAYTALSATWALSSLDSLITARTLLRYLVCVSMVYWAYMDDTDPYRLISSLVFASYVVAVYTVFEYGFSTILHATDDVLTTVRFANLNSIALLLAFGVICDLYLFLFRGFRIYSLVSVLSIVIIAFTQSRKAILFIALGLLLLLLFRFATSKSKGFRIFKIITILIFMIVAVYYLSKLPIFAGVNERIERMLNTIRGSGRTDESTLIRNKLIQVGWVTFLKNPLAGIGLGCTHIVASQYINVDAYLHNNYIELLAGGGIIAFILYYGIYAYILVGYFQLRKTDYQWFVFGFTLIVLTLIADYGRVSYYSGTIIFQIMTLFLIQRIVKRNREAVCNDDEVD